MHTRTHTTDSPAEARPGDKRRAIWLAQFLAMPMGIAEAMDATEKTTPLGRERWRWTGA